MTYLDKDTAERMHMENVRRQVEAARATAQAQLGPLGLIGEFPLMASAVFLAAILAWALVIANGLPPDGPSIHEARDKAKLECRQSGGSFEYFGTQGYHCIGGKQ